MDKEKAIVMAVAAFAEEKGIPIKNVKVLSFKEIQKSSLVKYIEENQIVYNKYSLSES